MEHRKNFSIMYNKPFFWMTENLNFSCETNAVFLLTCWQSYVNYLSTLYLFDLSVEFWSFSSIYIFWVAVQIKFNMKRFSNWENVDLYGCCILYHGNAGRAQDKYLPRYPERLQSSLSTFRMLWNKLITYGSFKQHNRIKMATENSEDIVMQVSSKIHRAPPFVNWKVMLSYLNSKNS